MRSHVAALRERADLLEDVADLQSYIEQLALLHATDECAQALLVYRWLVCCLLDERLAVSYVHDIVHMAMEVLSDFHTQQREKEAGGVVS